MRDMVANGEYLSGGAEASERRSPYYRNQMIQTAEKLEYCASPEIYGAWARLVIAMTVVTGVLIAFHGIGREFQGALACSACWSQCVETEAGARQVGPVTPLTDSVFLINYRESHEEVTERYSNRLEDAIVRGLQLWQEAGLARS